MKASALITLHDVDLAVKEAKRAVKNGAVGLSLCPEPINGRQIHDRYFDPLWQEAQEMNIPICFHPPARPQQPQVSKDRFEGHPNQALLVNPLRNPIEQILAVSAFCAGGVLERFPKTESCFSRRQLQLAAMAALPHRRVLGDAGQDGGYSAAAKAERIFPPAMFYFGRRRRSAGQERHRLLWATTISLFRPTIRTSIADGRTRLDEFLSIPIAEQSKRKILWDNCAKLYNHN